jgi:type III secretory pathway component EscU
MGVLGYVHVSLSGFSTTLWVMAILVFVLNVLITLAMEENEFSLQSAGLILLMLFTYSKLWVVVVVTAIYKSITDYIFKREVKWEKTVRYSETDAKLKDRKDIAG